MKAFGNKKIKCLREKVNNGLEVDDAISMLYQYEFTITESMKFLVVEYQMGLGDAKNLVSNHPVWREVVEASELTKKSRGQNQGVSQLDFKIKVKSRGQPA